MKKLLGYFFAGLAVVLPITATIWLINYFITSVQGFLSFETAAIGLGVALLTILATGYFMSSYLGSLFWARIENLIIKLPLLGLIYKALKDVTTAFVGKENRFSEPVLVKLTSEEIYKIGFITNKNAWSLLHNPEQTEQDDQTLYAVYFPLSFSLSGDLFLVPSSKIKSITRKPKDVMQAIVSGGIIKVD